MKDKQEKCFGAMRLFEALSSIDEDLLERCDQRKKVVPIWRYARVMAACICLVVVGTVTWIGSRGGMTKENASADCAAPESVNQMAAADTTTDAMPEVAFDAMTEADTDMPSERIDGTSGGAETVGEEAKAEEAADEEGMAEAEVEAIKTDEVQQNTMDSCSVPVEKVVEYLSEEELMAVEVLGEYIPDRIPKGYVFESGYKSDEGGIHVCWCKGMDSIMISVAMYEGDEEDAERIVDLSKPETYDTHRYEIPYASTVPEEYRQVFDNPIFLEKDFSSEAVRARMKRVSDLGDTDTPRGRFSILYDSGVIMNFSGDCEPELVWEMFGSREE